MTSESWSTTPKQRPIQVFAFLLAPPSASNERVAASPGVTNNTLITGAIGASLGGLDAPALPLGATSDPMVGASFSASACSMARGRRTL
jgi:hypothetical protein